MQISQRKIDSLIGPLYLIASAKGLRGVHWDLQRRSQSGAISDDAFEILDRAEMEITEYLSGERKSFDLPLDIHGTDFQKQVWQALTKIPYGETRSYKDVARALGDENASRAVGTANGINPLCLIIPCHRVISSDGSLGGYSGGLAIKMKLLNLEGVK